MILNKHLRILQRMFKIKTSIYFYINYLVLLSYHKYHDVWIRLCYVVDVRYRRIIQDMGIVIFTSRTIKFNWNHINVHNGHIMWYKNMAWWRMPYLRGVEMASSIVWFQCPNKFPIETIMEVSSSRNNDDFSGVFSPPNPIFTYLYTMFWKAFSIEMELYVLILQIENDEFSMIIWSVRPTMACIKASNVDSGKSVLPPRVAESTSSLNSCAVKSDKSVCMRWCVEWMKCDYQ